MKKILISLVAILLIAAAYLWNWLTAVPQVRDFSQPAAASQWQPQGVTLAYHNDYSVIPQPDAFHTMHSGNGNTDEVWTTVAPSFEFSWAAETNMYVPEGPSFDNEGNLYFSPMSPVEDVALISLNAETGERRWAIQDDSEGTGAGHGAPLILNDPEQPGKQIIYFSTYETAYAVSTSGDIIWQQKTGLSLQDRPADEPLLATHHWGMNYHQEHDILIGVTGDGYIHLNDRKTGKKLSSHVIALPGKPTPVSYIPPTWVSDPANAALAEVFGEDKNGNGWFSNIVEAIYGSGLEVSNFYSVDPQSGRIFIAATARDENDGQQDGLSDNGALYAYEIIKHAQDGFELSPVAEFEFKGGTGSTPSVRADGQRIYVSDDSGNIFSLDQNLKQVWKINVGDKIAASIGVAADNNELFAVSKFNVFKLIDRGDHATVEWKAKLDAYPDFHNFNALSVTVAPNGIVISIGAGREVGKKRTQIPQKFGMALLDRHTGHIRHFAEGREESISVSSIAPDGSIYIANSSVRRAIAKGLFGDSVPDIIGGIQAFRVTHPIQLVQDAMCSIYQRTSNINNYQADYTQASLITELDRLTVLINQIESTALNKTWDDTGKANLAQISAVSMRSLLAAQNYVELANFSAPLCEKF